METAAEECFFERLHGDIFQHLLLYLKTGDAFKLWRTGSLQLRRTFALGAVPEFHLVQYAIPKKPIQRLPSILHGWNGIREASLRVFTHHVLPQYRASFAQDALSCLDFALFPKSLYSLTVQLPGLFALWIGTPPDLNQTLPNLHTLNLRSGPEIEIANNVMASLPRNLASFAIHGNFYLFDPSALSDLPQSLVSLRLTHEYESRRPAAQPPTPNAHTSFAWPPSLLELTVDVPHWPVSWDVIKLPSTLMSLDVKCMTALREEVWNHLPASLTDLTFSMHNFGLNPEGQSFKLTRSVLSKLPINLTRLMWDGSVEVSGDDDARAFPPRLRSFNTPGWAIQTSWDDPHIRPPALPILLMPRTLTELPEWLYRSQLQESLPPGLDSMTILYYLPGTAKYMPTKLTSITLELVEWDASFDEAFVTALPPTLAELSMRGMLFDWQLVAFLPRNLKKLTITDLSSRGKCKDKYDAFNSNHLPTTLESLILKGTSLTTQFMKGLTECVGLKTLDIQQPGWDFGQYTPVDLTFLPRSLTHVILPHPLDSMTGQHFRLLPPWLTHFELQQSNSSRCNYVTFEPSDLRHLPPRLKYLELPPFPPMELPSNAFMQELREEHRKYGPINLKRIFMQQTIINL